MGGPGVNRAEGIDRAAALAEDVRALKPDVWADAPYDVLRLIG